MHFIFLNNLELINLVRHIRAYPDDPLEDAFRNVFDFDMYKPETLDYLQDVMEHHGSVGFFLMRRSLIDQTSRLKTRHLGLEASRENVNKKVHDIKFEPKNPKPASEPKFGKKDPNNEEHHGGNTWAGGVSCVSFSR